MRFELRAIVAALTVCALILGLFIAGGARPAMAGASDNVAHGAGVHSIICRHHGVDLSVAGANAPANDRPSDHSGCPTCCLAAFTASAALPLRFASLARPMRAVRPVVYFAPAADHFETTVTGSVNGARAPPTAHA
jgi:hypothetical protein